jgi:NADPH-dependent 2,4-dienoyl-CoA reductase/sulfur reductase-like enzyme
MTRRDLLKVSSFALASLVVAKADGTLNIKKSDNKRVVICGAGFGGLTMAKYLKKFNPELEVVLIDKKDVFVSCPYSNVWLGEADDIGLEDLTRDYFEVANKYDYSFVSATILEVDRKNKKVVTDSFEIEYDYVVMALGIEYDYSELFSDKEKANRCLRECPPALMPVGEHIAIKRELKNFKGGNFIITVPSGTYRCPPAPYERACMVAYYLKKNNIDGKVLVYDTRLRPAAKPDGFLDTFKTLYKDIIEYHPSSELKDVDFDKKEIIVSSFDKKELDYVTKRVPYTVANIIPKNKAHHLITDTKIATKDGGWAILKEPTFVSVSDESLYVVGDNTAYPYPKSGQMANSCAYIAAKELAYKTSGKKFDLLNETPANVCFSLVNNNPKEGLAVYHNVSFKDGIKVSATSTKKRDIQTGESIREWYEGIISDILS